MICEHPIYMDISSRVRLCNGSRIKALVCKKILSITSQNNAVGGKSYYASSAFIVILAVQSFTYLCTKNII